MKASGVISRTKEMDLAIALLSILDTSMKDTGLREISMEMGE